MGNAFTAPVDIANRALQHVGEPRIVAFTDQTRGASESQFLYDKVRRAELRRAVWRFSTVRVPLRLVTATSVLLNPTIYAAGTTYAAMAIVQDTGGAFWQSLVAANVGNTPAEPSNFWHAYHGPIAGDQWSSTVTYYIGDIVYKNGGNTMYISTTNVNLNNDPASGAPWLSLGASTTSTLTQFNPLGYGPSVVASTVKGIYRLPYGWLRNAAQDQKAASAGVLETSGGMRFSDWQLQGNYLFTGATTATAPIMLRFVADKTNVLDYDDLFCEMLAARLGMELCEPLKQSSQTLKDIAGKYGMYAAEARKLSAIELGSTEDEEMNYDPNVSTAGGYNSGQQQPPQQRG